MRRLGFEQLSARILLAGDLDAEVGVYCDTVFDGGGCRLLTTGKGGPGTGLSIEEGYALVTNKGAVKLGGPDTIERARAFGLGNSLDGKDPVLRKARADGENSGGGQHEPGNEIPDVGFDAYGIVHDFILDVDVADGVLANDFDPDGPNPLEAYLYELPQNGFIVLNLDGSFEYTPDIDYVGDDFFSYTAWDGEDSSDPMSVYLVVNGVDIQFYDPDDPNADPDGWITVTDETTEVWVGEAIDLRSSVSGIPFWNTITTTKWWPLLSGDTIAWWGNQNAAGDFVRPDNSNAEVFPITQAMKDAEQIRFYYVRSLAVPKSVYVTLEINGEVSVTMKTYFDVKSPTVQFDAVTSSVNLHDINGSTYAGFYERDPTVVGIEFTATGDPEDGAFSFVQLVSSVATRTSSTGFVQLCTVTNALDTVYPYITFLPHAQDPHKVGTHDSPRTKLNSSYIRNIRNDYFVMYLMWKLDDASSIPVPIKDIYWNWSYDVSFSQSASPPWVWTPTTATPPGTPPSYSSSPAGNSWIIPVWDSNFLDGVFLPPAP